MFILHPEDGLLINLDHYADIRLCPINPTHIDFYKKAPPSGERAEPDFTIIFETVEDKLAYWKNLVNETGKEL